MSAKNVIHSKALIICLMASMWPGMTIGNLLAQGWSHQGRHLHLPYSQFGIQRIKLYRYR